LFSSTQKNEQLRATMLGVGMLLMITEVYPSLRAMLAESMASSHKDSNAVTNGKEQQQKNPTTTTTTSNIYPQVTSATTTTTTS
jgi:hypothetical protein